MSEMHQLELLDGGTRQGDRVVFPKETTCKNKNGIPWIRYRDTVVATFVNGHEAVTMGQSCNGRKIQL